MSELHRTHPLASVTGLFALVVWSFYALYAALSYPASLTSVLVGACFGLIACLAVIFNFAYWRAAVLLASFVYLLLYVIRIIRMTAIANHPSFFSGLSFYYSISWRVTAGSFEEKALLGGLLHAYLEFVMPVLDVGLILVILISSRDKRSISSIVRHRERDNVV
jgi:hypothetical protein